MLSIPRRQRKPLRLELTPLIDCVFLLLIFFMLSSSLLTPAVPLTLPVAANDARPQNNVTVTLDENGRLFVNSEQVSMERLADAVREKLRELEKKDVTFRGDKEMRFERFVQALAAIRASGAENVHIAHQQ